MSPGPRIGRDRGSVDPGGFPATRPPARPELIAPGSDLHSMLCDATTLLYPLPAFLLPLLHPATADSTMEHDHALSPDAHAGHLLRRVVDTFEMVGGVVYGREESGDVARAIRDLHRDLGGDLDGQSYHPWSRDLWTWNWAAITAAILDVHGAVRGWPSPEFRAGCYLGMVEVGRRFGVLGMPEDVADFDRTWPDERDRVADTSSEALRRVAGTIRPDGMIPPPILAWMPRPAWAALTFPVRHLFRVSLCAAVPLEHRRALDLPVGRFDDVHLALHRTFWRLVPRSLTHQAGLRYFALRLGRGQPVWRTRFSPEGLAERRHEAPA